MMYQSFDMLIGEFAAAQKIFSADLLAIQISGVQNKFRKISNSYSSKTYSLRKLRKVKHSIVRKSFQLEEIAKC